MISAVTSATHTQPVAQSQSTASSPAKTQGGATAKPDTAQLSSAAQAALTEATETPAQTAKEAGGGDIQAQRLLAKEAAAKADQK